jgi:phospholipase/lecithinase/hemolysin
LNQNRKEFEAATIVAQTGWTTDELAAAMDTAQLAPPYDYASLLIGVNNQYRGRSVENFETEFIQLLERAITLGGQEGTNIFVLSIPDWGVMPFAEGRNRVQIAQEIDQFNTVIQAICRNKNIAYFDITAISREAITNTILVAQDGLHPSGTMYARWVATVLPFFNATGDE